MTKLLAELPTPTQHAVQAVCMYVGGGACTHIQTQNLHSLIAAMCQ